MLPLCQSECLFSLSFQRAVFHPMRKHILAEFFGHHRFVSGSATDVHLRQGIAFASDDAGTKFHLRDATWFRPNSLARYS